MTNDNMTNITDDPKLGRLLGTVITEVKSYAEGQISQIKKLTDIGLALSGEKSINRLLERIVDEARYISSADAGTLYILDNASSTLKFEIMQNDTLGIRQGGASGQEIKDMPNVPLYDEEGQPNHSNVSSYVALTGEQVNIPDVYQASGFDFTGPKTYDESSGYRSRSMLVMPLRNHEEKTIGVLQLLNAKDPDSGKVISFMPENVDLVASLASQAAIALTNAQLIQDLKDLFDSFIKSIATAIDEKSPFTGGHINRVVKLTMDIAEEINRTDQGYFKDIFFNEDELEELRLAAWMHDVGKITTPEHIVNKINKLDGLFDRVELIETRFRLIQQIMENECRQQKLELLQNSDSRGDYQSESDQLDQRLNQDLQVLNRELELLKAINCDQQTVTDETIEQVKAIAAKTYQLDGNQYPYLRDDEVACLTILRGNLLDEERRIIEHHAEMTHLITRELPFPERLRHVPEYASRHHEKLDGSGYPHGLKNGDIPLQARIIAIADVFEALTAQDRPYKKPMKISQALKILGFMKKDGHIDPEIIDLFMNHELYRNYCREELTPEQFDLSE
ncbi:MAG: HD domain-containing phosphohydrolase [Desulfosudaceae bacterium]